MRQSRPISIARITEEQRKTTQSGKAKVGRWTLEMERTEALRPDPLTGWAGSGDTDDGGFAPAAMRAFQRLAHQRGVAHAFETVVGATLRQLDQMSHQVAAHLLRIDEMRHAEFFGQLLPAGIDIDADDHVGAGDARPLDAVQPDAAQAEHHRGGAHLHLRGVDHRAYPRGHPAADVADALEGRVLADLGQRNLGQNRVVGEGRAAHVVQDRRTVRH